MPSRARSHVSPTGLSLHGVLQLALDTVGPGGRFDAKRLYRKNGGRYAVVPNGIGSVLRRAAREGLVRIVGAKRKQVLVYELTSEGLAFLARNPPPRAPTRLVTRK